MSDAPPRREALKIGRVLSRTTDVLRRNWLLLLVVAPAISWLPSLLIELAVGVTHLTTTIYVKIGWSVVRVLCLAVKTGVVVSLVLLDASGARARLAEGFRRLAGRFGDLAGLSFFLMAPGLLATYLLLPALQSQMKTVTPQSSRALMLVNAVSLCQAVWVLSLETIAAPANAIVVAEGVGWMGALRRALTMTRGSRFRIVVIYFLWGLIAAAPGVMRVIWLVQRHPAFDAGRSLADHAFGVLDTSLGTVWIVFATMIYLELIRIRGEDPEGEISEVFD